MDTYKFGLLKRDYLCYSAGCVGVNYTVVLWGEGRGDLGWLQIQGSGVLRYLLRFQA